MTLGAVLLSLASLLAQDRLQKLTPDHRKWLEAEVVYIITPKERDLFLSLESAEARDHFIEAFWAKRDPDPATLENEFKKEHYRRLDHANGVLGRDSSRPGWKTDRGRMYIILGQPRQIESYDGQAEVVSIEHWFYQGDPAKGLPPFFDLLFFKERDIGEYRLYNPLMDGPRALLRMGAVFSPQDDREVLRQLTAVSVDLARAAASIDRGEFAEGREARLPMGTGFTIAAIEKSPYRAVRTDYVDAYLRYGSLVSTDYSFNYVPSRGYVAVLDGPRVVPFVHYSIEVDPESFALESNEERTKFYTTVDFSLEVRDRAGELIAAQENPMYLELTASVLERVKGSPFSYEDSFPIVPGSYKLSIILRNRATKQYSVIEKELDVPGTSPQPALVSVVLAYGTELVGTPGGGYGTFLWGNTQILPASENTFTPADTVHVFAQAREVGPAHRLRFALSSAQERLAEKESKVGDYGAGPIIEPFSLLKLAPGDYRVVVQLLDPGGAVLGERSTPFAVSPRSSIPRPGIVYRRGFNVSVPGLLELALGQQLMASNRWAEAQGALEQAVAANNPQLPMARWKLANLVLGAKQAERALELLLPLKDSYAREYEVVEGLGFAYYFKDDFGQATTYLERAVTLRDPGTALLNALGDCYERLDQTDKARAALERSLKIDPRQEAVKAKLGALGKGK